ncbi:amino acid adenylation domain-containing protein [Lentzea sp. NPDC005914]|uniref:amino acid adenylation domain-containing protein n=1 Tax=Lentzea sp. NPDC005914 TaxID=3154572 RepID=UPI0033FE73E7
MSTVPRLFAASAAVDPDAIALVRGTREVSYRELDALANSLKHKLIARGVRPNDLVVVDTPRSIEYVIEILGVLKADAAYVPIDRKWPQARKDFVRQEATSVSDQVAHVMYTSGSTGQPKGVMISHAGIEAMAKQEFWRNHRKVLALASTAFDASTYEIWVPLLNGGQVVFPEHDVDIATIEHEIRRHGITAAFLTAALFHLVAQERPQALTGLKEVWSGGDVVKPEAAQRILEECPGIEVYNAYGPTENTVFVSRHQVTDTSGPLPIGKPFPGVRTRIDDGELLVAGPQLALGYHNRESDRFRDGWYRTGDRVTQREDGTLEFHGRADRQVKIRGHRVELEEVEAALRPLTHDCTVTAHNGRLVAYVVSDNENLREELEKTLPDYLFPSEFVHLDHLPRNHADKVDRTALKTPNEHLICALAKDILGKDLTPHDRFITAGDSISAIQLVSRAREKGLHLSVRDVLDHDIRTLATKVHTAPQVHQADFAGELTPLQEGLYFHALIEPGSYVVQLVFHLAHEVDAARLHQAARMLVTRNPALRAGFRPGPTQFVEQRVVVPWQETEDLEALLATDREVSFDLATPPLLRFTLVQNNVLVMTYHHLLFDGWSVPLLAKELFGLYHDEELPLLPPFHHHLAWLRNQPKTDAWQKALNGLDEPTLVATGPGTRPHARLEGTLPRAGHVARQANVTLNTVVQTAWALLLVTMTGKNDVVFGATVSGRPADLPGVENIVGALINTIPVRITLSAEESAHDLLSRVQNEQHALIAHHHVGLAEIQREAGLGQLFDTITTLEAWPESTVDEIESVDSLDAPHYPLSLAVQRDLTAHLNYRPDLFSHNDIRTVLRRLNRIIEALANNTRIAEIDALDPEEHLLLESWNATETEVPDHTLPELFTAQAQRTPQATAISYRGQNISYADLHDQVDQLAQRLNHWGVTNGDRVALKMHRSPELVIAMLAVTRAGAAYVPIDPGYPAGRIALMQQDAEPKLTLESLPDFRTTTGEIPLPHFDDTAYVIYTSGSTGRPKGVEVTHRGIASLAIAQRRTLGVTEGSRVLQWSSPSFDAAFWEIISALLTGATLVIADADDLRPGDPLSDLLHQERITHVTLPPSVLAALPDTAIPPRTTIISAGEHCPPDIATRWSKNRRFLNAYGPTESTVCATISDPITGPDAPIGRPIENTKVHVLDALGRPVPPGVTGELHIEGRGVAQGYLHGERFTTYRTGDLARWRHDGNLDHLGRADDQIKLRGHRVEPAEIEHALNRHDDVRTSAVVATGTTLVAFVVTEREIRPAALRTHLQRTLPRHMVPSIETTDALPLTPNGKLDRKALTSRALLRRLDLAGQDAPTTPAQHHICAAYAEVLGRDRVGVHDDFFTIGGDSLLLTRLQTLLDDQVTIADLHTCRTPATLAAHLERGPGTATTDRAARIRTARVRKGPRG